MTCPCGSPGRPSSGRGRAGGPGGAAYFKELLGEGLCDLSSDRVGVASCHVGVDPTFDFDPQGPAGPSRSGVGVLDAGHRSGNGLDSSDLWVYAVGEAEHTRTANPREPQDTGPNLFERVMRGRIVDLP